MRSTQTGILTHINQISNQQNMVIGTDTHIFCLQDHHTFQAHLDMLAYKILFLSNQTMEIDKLLDIIQYPSWQMYQIKVGKTTHIILGLDHHRYHWDNSQQLHIYCHPHVYHIHCLSGQDILVCIILNINMLHHCSLSYIAYISSLKHSQLSIVQHPHIYLLQGRHIVHQYIDSNNCG